MVIHNYEDDNLANYSNLSIEITKQIRKIEKKNDGIYFTPPNTIIKNINVLKKYLVAPINILEPACGTCEYITYLNKSYDNLKVTGIEYNKTIYDAITSFNNDNIQILNENYLNYESEKKYDLIIGNPPYYVMKKHNVDPKYYDYFDGRPNIFILFIVKSLELLNDNGILSFVLPKNFMNCLYYNKTREHINKYFQILEIIECNDDYIDTKQETIILIIKKNDTLYDNNSFYLNIENYTIFGVPNNIIKLKKLYENSSNLKKLGFKVNVGNIVWNQCKDELTDDNSKTLLIYTSDIKDQKLNIQNYLNKDKKNYINKKGDKGIVLLLNRGYGVGQYKFEYCLLDMESEYLVENHLICIKYISSLSSNEARKMYKKVIKSFNNKKTQEFIKLYFGNNAINTTELCELLPIYYI